MSCGRAIAAEPTWPQANEQVGLQQTPRATSCAGGARSGFGVVIPSVQKAGVYCTCSAGDPAAIAKKERVRLSERVQAGLSRARAQGKALGSPKAAVRPERVIELRDKGMSIRQIAEQTGVSAITVRRILKADEAA